MQILQNLRVYQSAEALAAEVYRTVRLLPADERWGLAQQLRGSVISVGSNIAEGCGRDGKLEFARFLRIAAGSANEVEFQLRIACRLELLQVAEAEKAIQQCIVVQRMLVRLLSVLSSGGGRSYRKS